MPLSNLTSLGNTRSPPMKIIAKITILQRISSYSRVLEKLLMNLSMNLSYHFNSQHPIGSDSIPDVVIVCRRAETHVKIKMSKQGRNLLSLPDDFYCMQKVLKLFTNQINNCASPRFSALILSLSEYRI